MAKTSGKKAEKGELPGVPIERFEAGVRALVDLRDRGKFLVFLARRRSARLVGQAADFLEELSVKLDRTELKLSDAREVLEEIRRFLSTRVGMRSNDQVSHFLIDSVYDDESEKLTAAEKNRFREQLEKKVRLVEEELYTPALRTREQRFASATAACMEDLEFELVEERSTTSADEPFHDPFLRLRLRYSKGSESTRDFGFFGFLGPNPFETSELHSFELECDESDIDLLMLRLAAAKRRLLAARENKARNNDA